MLIGETERPKVYSDNSKIVVTMQALKSCFSLSLTHLHNMRITSEGWVSLAGLITTLGTCGIVIEMRSANTLYANT